MDKGLMDIVIKQDLIERILTYFMLFQRGISILLVNVFCI